MHLGRSILESCRRHLDPAYRRCKMDRRYKLRKPVFRIWRPTIKPKFEGLVEKNRLSANIRKVHSSGLKACHSQYASENRNSHFRCDEPAASWGAHRTPKTGFR